MKVHLIAGARPNFMKITPIWKEMRKHPNEFEPTIIHTGQHFDYEMSGVFFGELELPKPDVYLGIGAGSHSEQTAKIMLEFEKILAKKTPNIVIVVGDVKSTLACALATAKFRNTDHLRNGPIIVHVEAGLRSFDELMPEEINRKLTDHVSDVLFTTCEDVNENLKNEDF